MIRRFLLGDELGVEERDGKPSKIVGYAARFYNGEPGTQFQLYTNVYERIMPGAFTKALERGDDTRALFNHDPNLLLGRTVAGTLELEQTTRGLRYRITPNTDTQVTRDVLSHIARGDVSGSSFAFTIDEESWRREGDIEVREIRSLKLYDVSPVTYPAYSATSVGVRAEADNQEWRGSYDAWIAAQKESVDAELATFRARAVLAGIR